MLLAYVVLGVIVLHSVWAQTNITIDDQDQRITYFPSTSWRKVEGSDFDIDGSHMLTEDPDAYAEITMTFSSFYFLSALYPYEITTNILVDGILAATVDLEDYDSPHFGGVASDVVASFPGMTNQQHTIRVVVPPGADSPGYAIVDAFIFTTDPSLTSSVSSSSTTASATTTSSTSTTSTTSFSPSISSTTSSATTPSTSQTTSLDAAAASAQRKARNLSIALGVICPILAILLFILLWKYCARRRRRNQNHHNNPSLGTAAFVNRGAGHEPLDGQDGGYVSPQRQMAQATADDGTQAATSTTPGWAGDGASGRGWNARPSSVYNNTSPTHPGAFAGDGRRPRRMSLDDAANSVVGGPPSSSFPPSSYVPFGGNGDGKSFGS